MRDAFDELRRAETSDAPPFRRVWTAAQTRATAVRPRRAILFAAAALILIIASAVILYRLRRPPAGDVTAFLSSAKWEGPTDFLLDTPGSALGSSVPTFARVPEYAVRKDNP